MSIGQTLYDLRKKKGISQAELAKALHVTRQTVSKWEADLSLPNMETMLQIADYYHVSITELLNIDESKENEISSIYEQISLVIEHVEKSDQKRKKRDYILIAIICICFFIIISLGIKIMNKENVVYYENHITESQEDSSVFANIDDSIISMDLTNQTVLLNYKVELKQYTENTKCQIVFENENDQFMYDLVSDEGGNYSFHEEIPLKNYSCVYFISDTDGKKEKSYKMEENFLNQAFLHQINIYFTYQETNNEAKQIMDRVFYDPDDAHFNDDRSIQYKGSLQGNIKLMMYYESDLEKYKTIDKVPKLCEKTFSATKKTTIQLSQEVQYNKSVGYMIEYIDQNQNIEISHQNIKIMRMYNFYQRYYLYPDI